MSKLVYLCGPISGCSYGECTDWRAYAGQELNAVGVEVLSPMRGKKYLAKETAIGDHYEKHVMSTAKAITARDRFDTMRADLIISNLLDSKKVSIGSMIELGWADAARVPIIVVMEETNLHWHAMVQEVAGWVVSTLEDALFVAKTILVPGV